MGFKVSFPANVNEITVSGLFQWDYGQVLEIESADIGSEIVEVHFSCSGMSEAIVCSCSFSNGVGTVTIPDQCLEQASTITAWIYRINGTTGYTFKTIILPITPRTRPSKAREITSEFSDKYTELITEVNEAVENLESGNVTVAKATSANNANYAATAGNASNANYATSAGSATRASSLTPSTRSVNDSEYTITWPGIYVVLIDCKTCLTNEIFNITTAVTLNRKEILGSFVRFIGDGVNGGKFTLADSTAYSIVSISTIGTYAVG